MQIIPFGHIVVILLITPTFTKNEKKKPILISSLPFSFCSTYECRTSSISTSPTGQSQSPWPRGQWHPESGTESSSNRVQLLWGVRPLCVSWQTQSRKQTGPQVRADDPGEPETVSSSALWNYRKIWKQGVKYDRNINPTVVVVTHCGKINPKPSFKLTHSLRAVQQQRHLYKDVSAVKFNDNLKWYCLSTSKQAGSLLQPVQIQENPVPLKCSFSFEVRRRRRTGDGASVKLQSFLNRFWFNLGWVDFYVSSFFWAQ